MAMPAKVELPDGPVVVPRLPVQLATPEARTYPTILARPIFAPDRAPVILQAQSSGNLAGFEVLGTAIAGNVSAALVRDATGRILRVKPSDTLQGWRLVSIERTELTFDRDGERRTLAVTAAAPSRGGVTTRLGGAKSSDDDDDDDSSSSSNSNSSDDDDDN